MQALAPILRLSMDNETERKVFNALFPRTHNSTRSLTAEVNLNDAVPRARSRKTRSPRRGQDALARCHDGASLRIQEH